jgi:hypothetical protein
MKIYDYLKDLGEYGSIRLKRNMENPNPDDYKDDMRFYELQKEVYSDHIKFINSNIYPCTQELKDFIGDRTEVREDEVSIGLDFKEESKGMWTADPHVKVATVAIKEDNKEQGVWLREKPKFNKECSFVTATKYVRNGEDVDYEYSFWMIKKLDGEDENGAPGWYWGLLCGDGEEWGDLEDLTADYYYILPTIPKQ